MEIKLIRHTTPDVPKGTCYGQSDISLKNTFEAEAELVLQHLTTFSDYVLYTSPLKRCVFLAEKISPYYQRSKALLEMNFGDWELQAWDAIPREESALWMADFVNVAVPNGESYIELHKRVSSFMEMLISKNENAIIVTHSGVIRSILSYISTMELKDSFAFELPYGSVISISYENEQFKTDFKLN